MIALDKGLADAGFSSVTPSIHRRLVLCTAARTKCGKTHFACTTPSRWPDGTPAVTAVVSSDKGTKPVLEKFPDRQWALIEFRVPEPGKRQNEYENEWAKMSAAIEAATTNPRVRNLVVDDATSVYEILRLAKFGKLEQVKPHHYGVVNREMRDLVERAYEREDLNAVWIHRVKKEYKQNRKGEDSWTGEYEMAGWGDLPYVVDMFVHNYWVEPNGEEPGRFGVKVVGVSRQTPDLSGQRFEGDMCNFGCLASVVYPDLDQSYWL